MKQQDLIVAQAPDYDVPVGLGFAHLKGSAALLGRVLDNGRPYDEVYYARVQLHRALELFQSSIDRCEQRDFLTRYYERLSRDLIKDSHTILGIASSRLSCGLKLV